MLQTIAARICTAPAECVCVDSGDPGARIEYKGLVGLGSRSSIAGALLFVVALYSRAEAQSAGRFVVDDARFTVITKTLIRMEFDPEGRFVDAPSYFAIDRGRRYGEARIIRSGATVVIDTGALELSYTPDGQSFSPSNLSARVRKGGALVSVSPMVGNTDNLGGATRTLDGATGSFTLDDGVLSRSGFYLLDDSRGPLLRGDWVEARQSHEQDLYLFGYGDDYKAGLVSLTAIGGRVPMPRRYALGTWYSRYWPYTADEFRNIAREYGEHDLPLDVMVLDMDWHRDGWTGFSWNRDLIADPAALLRS